MITVEDLGLYLQQDLTDYEAEAQAAIDDASSVVRDYCKRTFTQVTDEQITLHWRPALILPNPPVTTISSFEIDGVAATYDRDASGRLWPTSIGKEVTVTYTHGYTTIPDTVALVVKRIAARIFKNPTGRTSYSADTMSYQSSPDIAPRVLTGDEMAALRTYRLRAAQ